MNRKWKENCRIIIPIIVLILFLQLFKEFLYIATRSIAFVQDPPPPGVETLALSGTINRTQMSNWFDKNKFADVNELVEVNPYLASDLENVKYLIEVTKNSAFNFTFKNITKDDVDIRKHLPILSRVFIWGNSPTFTVVGGVFYSPKAKFQSITCINNTSGWQTGNKPFIKDGKLICGKSTTKYD